MPDRTLLARLQALVDAPLAGEGAPSLAHVEHTLTDGYACALELETERSRLARRIGELAALETGDAEERTRELSFLSRTLASTEGDLSRLRFTLMAVRHRATALRTAAAV